jgi:hypothetical protein
MWPRKTERRKALASSQRALNISRIELRKVQSREPKIDSVAEEMHVIRERNHFAEQISILMANKRKGFL